MTSATRRAALTGGVALSATSLLGGCVPPARPALVRGLPFAPEQLADREALWGWVERLNSFGPRLTGYPAHEASIDLIARDLQAMGLAVQSDVHPMTRWTVQKTSLVVSGAPVPVAAAFAYSGRTGPQGITAPLVWLGEKPRSLEAAAGKIAVVPVKNTAIGFLVRDLMFTRKSFYPSREEADFSGTVTTPLLSGLSPGIDLAAARAAGVLGVICVFQDMSEDAARDQYNPFITPYQDCPALWVGPAAGVRLKAACDAGELATLTLQAELAPGVPTRTLFAVLEGTVPNETIIVNTHTDGPNACEENGPAALLALAQYMSRVPAAQRRRTIVFAFVTGHFQMPQFSGHGGQATSRWLRDHPELWDGKAGHRKAVAGLTIEHIGCREWKDVADRSGSAPTGRLERELVYTTNDVMDQVFAEAVAGRTKIRALTVEPRNGVHLGEGQPLFAAGIPSIAMCPLPDYLCSARPGGDLDRLDPEFAHQQVQTFARALLQLDALPAEVLGSPSPAETTLLGRVVKLGQ